MILFSRNPNPTHDGCGGGLIPTHRPGWLLCQRCLTNEPVAPDPAVTLSEAEREQLSWYKARYMAQAHGFEESVARRLAFVRALVRDGRIGRGDQAPAA